MRAPHVILIAIAAAGLGAYLHAAVVSAERINIASNRFALEGEIKERLADFHAKNSRYPSSLDEIDIAWIKSAERRKMLFAPFYYENRGDTYVLWWPKTDIKR